MSDKTLPRMVPLLTGIVAATGIVIGLVWGGAVVAQLADEWGSMESTEIPGELDVHVGEAGDQVVYYERRSLVATPVDPDIDLSVTGPGGASVPTEPTTRIQYRMFQTVRQAHATFAASEPGRYTVTVDGQTDDDEAAIAVGTETGAATLGGLVGPVVVLVVGLVAVPLLVLARRHGQLA